MAGYFLSCDWGTSSFRLKYVRLSDLHVMGEVTSQEGIATTFYDYEKLAIKNPAIRQAFYLNVIAEQIVNLESKLQISLNEVPIVLSGMASSTIGMLSLPYSSLPFTADGSDINTHRVKSVSSFRHDVLIISGVAGNDDVMRGEETQLIGCIDDNKGASTALYIFPGTHSKHIMVKNGRALFFTTYMTGEFFALLSTKSVLSNAVSEGKENMESFKDGIRAASTGNLLHAAFLTRTNDLFSKYSKEDNYNYLSGVLIGTELKELQDTQVPIFLCCSGTLQQYYAAALDELGLADKTTIYPAEWVDNAVVRGQAKIFMNNTQQ